MAQQPLYSRASIDVRRSIHDHWQVFLGEGVVLFGLGVAAMVVPPLAGLLATVVLGWIFLFVGAVGLIAVFNARGAPGFIWALLSAVLAVAAGLILLWHPLAGLATLTYVLIAFFIVDGALMVVLALEHRRELSGRWEWMLVNGLIDLALAGLIISGLPGTLTWALGILVGVDFLFGGISLIAMALSARDA
jgi:uncharacterized membrane protein HdeD (DUF308 family)